MIKILSCKNKNYLTELIDFLDKRRSGKEADTKIVTKILKDINYTGNHDNRDITNITYDSRKVRKNCLFIAVSGENCDGHDFINEAGEIESQ